MPKALLAEFAAATAITLFGMTGASACDGCDCDATYGFYAAPGYGYYGATYYYPGYAYGYYPGYAYNAPPLAYSYHSYFRAPIYDSYPSRFRRAGYRWHGRRW